MWFSAKQSYSHEDVDLRWAFSLVHSIVNHSDCLHQGLSAVSIYPGNDDRALLGHSVLGLLHFVLDLYSMVVWLQKYTACQNKLKDHIEDALKIKRTSPAYQKCHYFISKKTIIHT